MADTPTLRDRLRPTIDMVASDPSGVWYDGADQRTMAEIGQDIADWLRSDEVHNLMLAHLRYRIQDCACGWADLGKSHVRHVADMLAEEVSRG